MTKRHNEPNWERAKRYASRDVNRCEATQKPIFGRRQEAEAAIIRERKRLVKKPLRAYSCVHCGGWHITSQSKGNKAA